MTASAAMTEAEILSSVLELAELLNWRTAHFRPAQTKHARRSVILGEALSCSL